MPSPHKYCDYTCAHWQENKCVEYGWPLASLLASVSPEVLSHSLAEASGGPDSFRGVVRLIFFLYYSLT